MYSEYFGDCNDLQQLGCIFTNFTQCSLFMLTKYPSFFIPTSFSPLDCLELINSFPVNVCLIKLHKKNYSIWNPRLFRMFISKCLYQVPFNYAK